MSDRAGPLSGIAVYRPRQPIRRALPSGLMRLLAGFAGAVGALLALFGAFVVRVRLYDSLGEYKGIGNIGMRQCKWGYFFAALSAS